MDTSSRIDVARLAKAPALPVRIKPRWRGWLDVAALFLFVPAVAMLFVYARNGEATTAAIVYGTSVLLLFAVSATYHVPVWPVSIRALWRSADHSMIYVLIAGSYTPACLIALPEDQGGLLLTLVWSVTGLGLAKSMLWPKSPRAVNSAVYVAFGWLSLPFVRELWAGLGPQGFGLLVLGGLFYSVGAVIYTKRWCNFRPHSFGYHEVFHLLVVAAAACHFLAFWTLLT